MTPGDLREQARLAKAGARPAIVRLDKKALGNPQTSEG